MWKKFNVLVLKKDNVSVLKKDTVLVLKDDILLVSREGQILVTIKEAEPKTPENKCKQSNTVPCKLVRRKKTETNAAGPEIS